MNNAGFRIRVRMRGFPCGALSSFERLAYSKIERPCAEREAPQASSLPDAGVCPIDSNETIGELFHGNALARIDAGQCMPSTKLAMRFTALTAARQVEVRRATWDQFDLEAAVWTKPAEATKTAKSHRVPLSRQALDVLSEARKATRGTLVFPGSRPGAMMGNSVTTNALRTAGIAASGHWFRSSFKDWARHHDVDELLSEFALAHVEGSATVAAYARDDLLEKRGPVMQEWADCISK